MSKVIDVTLRLVDNFTKPMRTAITGLERSSKSFKRAGREIKKAGRQISSVGAGLTKNVTVPLVGIGAAAIKAGIDFESAFTGVKKTVDATPEQLEKIKKEIREMSKTMPMAATEIAAIAESAGQLGIKTENITSFTKTMADLSVATNLTSEEAASSLAKFANVTKMNQQEFENLGSAIVDLGNHFATTERDIVAMGTRIAGAGTQIGLTQGEIMGFATALSSVGIEAEMGGSAFSKAMIRMKVATATGLTQVEAITKKTGMSLRELQLMSDNDSKGFKDLAGSLGMTKTELNNFVKAGVELQNFGEISGMTSEQFKKLFETHPEQALSAFIQGLGNTEKAGKSTIEMLQDMGFTEVRLRDSLTRMANNSEGVAEAMRMGQAAFEENTALVNEANQRYATTESQLIMLKNKIVDVGVTLSDILIPPMMKVVEKVDKAVTAFSKLDKSTQTQIIKFAAFAAATGPALSIFGKVTQGVGGTVAMLGNLGEALPKVGKRAKSAGEILKTIKMPALKIPTGTKYIKSFFGTMKEMYKLNMDEMKGVFGKIPMPQFISKLKPKGVPKWISRIGGEFGIVGKQISFFKTKFKGVSNTFGTVGKAMFTFLGPAGSVIAIIGAIIIVGILLYKNWDKIKKGAKALGKTIKTAFINSGIPVDKFKEKIQIMVERFKAIVGRFKVYGAKLLPPFKKFLGFIGKVWLGGLKIYFSAIVGYLSGVLNGIMDWVNGVLRAFNGVITFVEGIFTGNWKKAWEGVKEIFGGIFDSLVGLVKTPFNALIGMINSVTGEISNISVDIPLVGEFSMPQIPKIPMLYTGTMSWGGGPAMVHDRGAEIIDLPKGSRVYPHDKSLQMARAEGAKAGKVNVSIGKIADTMVVRSEEDVRSIANRVVKDILNKICDVSANIGGVELGDFA